MDPTGLTAYLKATNETLSAAQKVWRWFQRFRYPKPKSGSIGILIGIATENVQGQLQIKNDFIRKMRQRLEKDDQRFQIIEVPEHHLDKVEKFDSALKLLNKCKSTFLISGLAKERNIAGKRHLVLEIIQRAAHKEIPEERRQLFSQEMMELIPGQLLIPQSDNLVGLELSADAIGLAAKYLSAIAVNISGEIQKSIEIFESLQSEITSHGSRVLGLDKEIMRRTAICLSAIRLSKAIHSLSKWRKRHLPSDLDEMMNELAKVTSEDARISYASDLARAIYFFLRENDSYKARSILEKWNSSSLAEWAFSLGFIHACSGKLTQTKRYYDIAFRREFDSRLVLELEEFIEWYLGQHPGKYELYFCLGRLQLEGRNEREIASDSFRSFLQFVPEGSHPIQVRYVKQLLYGSDSNSTKNASAKKNRRR